MEPGLRGALEEIRPGPADVTPEHFVVNAVPGYDKHYVGWDYRGAPCILLETIDSGFRAPLQLAGLEVQYSVPCEVKVPDGGANTRMLSVITCTSPNAADRDYFLHLMDTVLRIVGPRPALSSVVGAIAKLVEILQQLARPPQRGVIGLYGELTVIAVSSDPAACLSAWRSELDDRFDFSREDARLEAKATSERVRAHTFSLEQCSPPIGTHGAIASMLVEPNGGGQSIEELLAEIMSRLGNHPQACLKLQTTVAYSLGSALPGALSMRFDQALARSGLIFFDATAIPAVGSDVPVGVTRVRFQSDLTGLSPTSLDELILKCGAFKPLLPANSPDARSGRRGSGSQAR